MNNDDVTIIIPTLNEKEGMRWFMPQLRREWYNQLLIVDGGSTDGTLEYCRENNLLVIIQNGKGLPNAYDSALEQATGNIIITVTPDGNSLPNLIPLLIEKIREGYDMVIASRYKDHAKSHDDDFLTAIGNKVFTWLINVLFHASYTDTLVGLRAYRKSALVSMALYKQDMQGYLKSKFMYMNSWETGASIRAAKLKLKITEIPGDEPKRIGGIRKLNIIKNGTGVLLQILHEKIIGNRFIKYAALWNNKKKNG